jgi:hypothetical protein
MPDRQLDVPQNILVRVRVLDKARCAYEHYLTWTTPVVKTVRVQPAVVRILSPASKSPKLEAADS